MDIHPITTTDGVLLHLAYFPPALADRPVLLCTHGVGNTFYTTPLWMVARQLAGEGYGVAVLNNRGHEWVTMNMLDSRWTGAAYERIEDGVLDFTAALAWLERQGHRTVVLVGHSLGGLKAAYMQAFHPSPAVVALAMCSSPRLPDEKVWDWSAHEAILRTATDLVSSGRGDELMQVAMPTNTPAIRGLMSAGTYVNKYGPGAATTALRYAERIKVPTFLLAGSEEKPQRSFARDLEPALINAGSVTRREIDGADHMYTDRHAAVAHALGAWLGGL
ncbi:MAG: alpha/beta fold hydrolase [Xanthobacteraceae bacterium]|nr:alpha/beta fold hydrolase [Xanthobacteraceae bacterium]